MLIVVGAVTSVSRRSAEISLFILLLSAIFVYAPCRLNYRSVTLGPQSGTRWLPDLYTATYITYPFVLYKNVRYFLYLRSHGGYLAVYTDGAAVLQSAGTLVRGLSLVGFTALLILYVLERRPRRVRLIVLLLFVAIALDLLIGFRGEFFTQALGIWFIHYLKTGGRFRLPQLMVAGLIVSLLAVWIAAFREQQQLDVLSPIGFVAAEGISLGVTEAAVEYFDDFSRYGSAYIWNGFVMVIVPSVAERGHSWSGDLSKFLNLNAAERGYGTGSSYLAELYLFGGIPAVVAGSLFIGYFLSKLHQLSARIGGGIVLAFLLPSLIYLPRVELLNPLAVMVRMAMSAVVLALIVYACRSVARFLRLAAGRNAVAVVGPS
jgi:hypothetical protein